ncbi:MAG TPA: hypothetical protein VIV66_15210 [Pyrinomonadaceae bacterium]
MKNQTQTLLRLCGLILITCAAPHVFGQQDRGSVIRRRATTTTTTTVDSQQKRETQVADTGRIINEPPLQPNSIRVRIRYQKEYGYITTRSFNDDGPYSCDAFTVDANFASGESGTFGGYKSAGNTIIQPERMREQGNHYICDFTITGVPLDQSIIVKASMISNPKILTTRWRAGSQPQPPPGSERMILDGSSSVMLTNSNPTATVDFEMVYRSVQLPPR